MNLMMLFIGDFTYPTRALKPLLKLSLILSTPSDSPFFHFIHFAYGAGFYIVHFLGD